MAESWIQRKILILGKTYPSYSRKYTETACTGGLLDDSLEMIRLYPIPYRYLRDSNYFKSWQWISADIKRDTSDPRPESFKVRFDSIEPLDEVPSTRVSERVRLIEHSPHFFKSIRDLKDHRERDAVSLGMIKPAEVLQWRVEPRSEEERDLWEEKEQEVTAQYRLIGGPVKPLDFPEAKFVVKWRCDDPECSCPHSMSINQWGIHELYRKLIGDPQAASKMDQAMKKHLDTSEKDVYFFLGSFRAKQFNFGLMDSYSAKRVPRKLF